MTARPIQGFGRTLSIILAWLSAPPCLAGDLTITVRDVGGQPLAEAVVYALPPAGLPPPPPRQHAIMDQLDKTFVPHVLAVQAGATVDFPNNDTINHHVYSFSPAKTFQLKLFKNDPRKHAVHFDKAGVVTLGCNIHDWMLGYVFVAPTPYHAVTNGRGQATLSLPDNASYTLKLWHPRANENLEALTRTVAVPADRTAELRLGTALKPKRQLQRALPGYED